ncbi:hypothetical protein [Wolbachia endosymbiont of Atemnus politus]|uniref:hypothetical protein n=1 Tax=Wolbachia endosymbiont of Atemnus politus TaxID=2682840 RepID=UPI001FE425B0|nr:hypothetical protein [Wolbachia endosymbiont of Atemnus politus]
MDLVRKVCNATLSVRNTFNIRVRQPLGSMTIYHQSFCGLLEGENQEMINDEVNVKKLELVNKLEGIASLELN